MEKFLRLDLQHFAEQGEDGGDEPKGDDHQDETPKGDESGTGDNPDDKQGDGADEGKNVQMTQAEFDAIIQKRLEREKKKADEAAEKARKEAEREQLKEQEKYKELYEQLQEDLNAQKQAALQTKKESLLAKAGYDEKQVERYTKYLEGETDEELQTALDELKQDIPPKKKYGDPSPGNGQKQAPKKTNLEDKGKTMYQRLKQKGKVKGRKDQ